MSLIYLSVPGETLRDRHPFRTLDLFWHLYDFLLTLRVTTHFQYVYICDGVKSIEYVLCVGSASEAAGLFGRVKSACPKGPPNLAQEVRLRHRQTGGPKRPHASRKSVLTEYKVAKSRRSRCVRTLPHPLYDHDPTLERPAKMAKGEQVYSVWIQKAVLLLLSIRERHRQMA